MNTNLPRIELKKFLYVSGAFVFLLITGIVGYGIGLNQADMNSRLVQEETANQAALEETGLVQVGPMEYRATIVAHGFSFHPNVLEIPTGATVHFEVTSNDVIHGYAIMGTEKNLTLIPGQVTTYSHTFNQPGEYYVECTQFCGVGHELMRGKIIVSDLRS